MLAFVRSYLHAWCAQPEAIRASQLRALVISDTVTPWLRAIRAALPSTAHEPFDRLLTEILAWDPGVVLGHSVKIGDAPSVLTVIPPLPTETEGEKFVRENFEYAQSLRPRP